METSSPRNVLCYPPVNFAEKGVDMRLQAQTELPTDALRDLERLAQLRKLNASPKWRNTDLYRLLYRKGLYAVAYQQCIAKLGTAGTGQATSDGFPFEEIENIINQLRDESYQPTPVRQVCVPGLHGKPGKLGRPSLRDMVLQEVIRLVMEAIYDSPDGPFFETTSHGFRKGRSPHTALKEIQRTWSGVNWFLSGDMRSWCDELHHERLIAILGAKIQDQRFLHLIRKLLKSGSIDREWRLRDALIDTPQGGILSPLLTNVLFDRLDKCVENLKETYEEGKARKSSREYRALAAQRQVLATQGLARSKEFRQIVRQLQEMPSLDPDDQGFIRLKYIRYADAWLIGVTGSRQLAEVIRENIREFLGNELQYIPGDEKMRVVHARTEQVEFLGMLISIGRAPQSRQSVVSSTSTGGQHSQGKPPIWEVVLRCPTDSLIRALAKEGFCNAHGKPEGKGAYTSLDAEESILRYSSINRGLQQYYRVCDNFGDLTRVQYVLKYSLAKTLAEKYRKNLTRVFQAGEIKHISTTSTGEQKEVRFSLNRSWRADRNAWSAKPFTNPVSLALERRSRSGMYSVRRRE
jgi:retron-type reverse transcriptase